MRKTLISALLLATSVVPLAACYNDSETASAEQEFRSAYVDAQPRQVHEREVPLTVYHGLGLWLACPFLVLVGYLWVRSLRSRPADTAEAKTRG